MLGQALGLKDEEFDTLQADNYRDSPLFDDREKAVLAWAEAMTLNTAKRDNKVWDDLKKHFSDAEIVAEHQRLCREKFGELAETTPFTNVRDPARRLRIGYVSPDFWMHPVARFMLPLLQHHNQSCK